MDDFGLSRMKVLCSRILKHYGATHQLAKTNEELLELRREVLARLQGHPNTDEMIDETADVLIMGVQMALLMGWDEVSKQIEYKLKRQEARIDWENTTRELREFIGYDGKIDGNHPGLGQSLSRL